MFYLVIIHYNNNTCLERSWDIYDTSDMASSLDLVFTFLGLRIRTTPHRAVFVYRNGYHKNDCICLDIYLYIRTLFFLYFIVQLLTVTAKISVKAAVHSTHLRVISDLQIHQTHLHGLLNTTSTSVNNFSSCFHFLS